jgi:hypothetical protein
MQENGPFRSVAQVVGGAQLSSHGRSQTGALTVSFVGAAKGRDETIRFRRDGREQEQQWHATTTTRTPRQHLVSRTGGPAPSPAATRQETAAPQQVRPSGAEPARFAGNFFSSHLGFFLLPAAAAGHSTARGIIARIKMAHSAQCAFLPLPLPLFFFTFFIQFIRGLLGNFLEMKVLCRLWPHLHCTTIVLNLMLQVYVAGSYYEG